MSMLTESTGMCSQQAEKPVDKGPADPCINVKLTENQSTVYVSTQAFKVWVDTRLPTAVVAAAVGAGVAAAGKILQQQQAPGK